MRLAELISVFVKKLLLWIHVLGFGACVWLSLTPGTGFALRMKAKEKRVYTTSDKYSECNT
jgi:hypothetical protein